jgi:hypothetical protein
VQWNAAGNFTLAVAVSNACGTSLSREIAINVNPVTAITAQPVPQSVCKGTMAKFIVVTTGASRKYQWQKSGTNIPGAIDSIYTIPITDSSHLGDYSVVVTGACGTVTSSTAKLSLLSAANCITAATQVNELAESIRISPNPTQSNALIEITAKKIMKAEFELIDMNGRVLLRFSKNLVQGENKFDLSLTNLAPAVYQLRGHSSGIFLPIIRFVKL